MTSLHQRLLDRCDDHVDLVLSPQPYAAALRAVVELCAAERVEAQGGAWSDCDTVWPSDILKAIATELGIDHEETT